MKADSRYIVVDGQRYLIRGNDSATALRKRYAAFCAKFSSKLTFARWLIERGGAYFKENR